MAGMRFFLEELQDLLSINSRAKNPSACKETANAIFEHRPECAVQVGIGELDFDPLEFDARQLRSFLRIMERGKIHNVVVIEKCKPGQLGKKFFQNVEALSNQLRGNARQPGNIPSRR
jgi:hypothetical protein